MKKALFFCLLILALASAQQKQRLAVLPSVGELESKKLDLLTDKVREVASKTLPQGNFILLRQDAVVEAIGAEEYFAACKEGTCIGELAKKANANYGARCDVFMVDNNSVLKFELYSVKDEAILETFTDYDAQDFYRMLAVLEERLPGAFKKMLGASSGSRAASLLVAGGISGLEKAGGYEVNYEKSYLANISTEPAGATLSFNGMPIASCSKTPCKAELPEGDIRIVAALEQYETADTAVSIRQNSQSINIRLKANFGVLEIKPAYSDGIGAGKGWNLAINDRVQSSYENRFSPGNYEVKLSHECYEDISFKAGINKGSREVFEMARHLSLKTGGLVLSAEKDGEPVSEQVFVNGRQIGETPFSGTVPVCAEIGIGVGRDKIDAKVAYKQTVRHKHKIDGVLTDSRDGRKYKIVRIGKQTWMAENLNYSANGSKCYGNQESNCQKYGRLYNWATAKTACPKGWHLPSGAEWTALTDFAGGSKVAGTKLKAKSGWNEYGWFSKKSGNGTDEFGFSALPGGYVNSRGYFSSVGDYGSWSSATEINAAYACYRNMDCHYRTSVLRNDIDEAYFNSVRCVQD
jgi:uncharacterized protein (TIGR02145 family)